MPRPKNGYKNAAGQPIPGTHDPISRFMDQTALKFWAYKQGKAGLDLFDRSALDIGSAVHAMAELDLKGRPDREIECCAHEYLKGYDQLEKCFKAFAAFREWREAFQVRAVAQEVALVSERYQYGGTPDTIAMIGNGRGLLDFKTSGQSTPKPYPDQLVAMAAHANLWNENHPDMRLDGGCHLIMLPKDGSVPQHYAYTADDLASYWDLFKLYLQAFHVDKACSDSKRIAAGRMTGARKPSMQTVAEKVKPASKPRVRVKTTPQPYMSIGEMLRAYGHVSEAVA